MHKYIHVEMDTRLGNIARDLCIMMEVSTGSNDAAKWSDWCMKNASRIGWTWYHELHLYRFVPNYSSQVVWCAAVLEVLDANDVVDEVVDEVVRQILEFAREADLEYRKRFDMAMVRLVDGEGSD